MTEALEGNSKAPPVRSEKEEFDKLSNKDGIRVDQYSQEHIGRLGASLRGT